LEFIDQNKITAKFEISDGRICKSVTKTKGAVNRGLIESNLTELLKSSEKAVTATKFIFDNRPVVERTKLKRTYNRKK